MDKLSRFRIASAARRSAREGASAFQPRRLEQWQIDAARCATPEHFLRRHYPDLKTNSRGTSLWVPKVLRADVMEDGHWLACGWQMEKIGDNISLLQFVVPGMSLPEAVLELTGAAASSPIQPQTPVSAPVAYPKLPPVGGEDRGRAYLRGRGISSESIEAAEQAGVLRYAESGVVFLGRDLSVPTRSVRSATLRYFEPVLWEGDLLSKRDVANSDKRFPGLLPGDPVRVVVVEGGVSGLAARDIVVRQGQAAPTVIVTGGVTARKWVSENAPMVGILAAAQVVEIWGEREESEEKQIRTDAFREKLALAIAEQRQGELPAIVYPPDGVKDAAGWNLIEVSASPCLR